MILVLAFFSLEAERHRYGFAWDVQAPEHLTNHYPDWQETDVATPQKFTETSKTVVLKGKMTHSHDLFMFVWGSHGVPSFENLPTGFEIPENSSSTVCHS